MADIYIGYCSDDRESFEKVNDVLNNRGWSIAAECFSDLPVREPLDAEASRMEATCCIFLWSSKSIHSMRMLHRAFKAFCNDALISVFVNHLPPLQFLSRSTAIFVLDSGERMSYFDRQGLCSLVSKKTGRLDRPTIATQALPELNEYFDAPSRIRQRLGPYKAGRSLLEILDRIRSEPIHDQSRLIKDFQMELIEEMFESGSSGLAIQNLLTRTNISLYRRTAERIVAEMAAAGWGDPPFKHVVLALGSCGRGENFSLSDQDNGMIIDNYPDVLHSYVDRYFMEFTQRLCHDLDDLGLPYCKGYCMAINPLWRKTLSQWTEQVQSWMDHRSFVSLRLTDIFFDFQPVWGDIELAKSLRQTVTSLTYSNRSFLQRMYEQIENHAVSLDFFGNLLVERGKTDGLGRLDVKYGGLMPLVAAIRLMAIFYGIQETSTLKRIRLLNDCGKLDDEESDLLTRAFHFLTDIILRKELQDYRIGSSTRNALVPELMSSHDRYWLTNALQVVRNLRRSLRQEALLYSP